MKLMYHRATLCVKEYAPEKEGYFFQWQDDWDSLDYTHLHKEVTTQAINNLFDRFIERTQQKEFTDRINNFQVIFLSAIFREKERENNSFICQFYKSLNYSEEALKDSLKELKPKFINLIVNYK